MLVFLFLMTFSGSVHCKCKETPPPKCRANEVASKCAIQCPPQTCESIYTLYKCSSNITCTPGCDCIKGYLRDKNGICIPSQKCPATPPLVCEENEVASDCAIQCPPQTCESIYSSFMCDTDIKCSPGCDCKDGYLRDKNGVCIPSENCAALTEPPLLECGINEEASNCAVVCPPQTCESIYTDYLCTQNAEICNPGCNCKQGYLRNSTGVCIPSDQCSFPIRGHAFCSDPNASSVKCASYCQPTCERPDTSNVICVQACRPGGCVCNPGYILDKAGGKCIREKDCPKTPPPKCRANEVASKCAIQCPPQTCESIYTLYKCSSNITCTPGCDCIKGYLRDKNGICIPSQKCPATPPLVCEENEVASACAIQCPPQTCESIYSTFMCDTDIKCIPGCDCKDGYLRDKNGVCIPSEKCAGPQRCSDPNASPQDCPSSCQPTCARPDTSNLDCIAACLPSGCVCNPGYILDKYGGTCIKKEDCPNTKTCSDPNASPQNCPSSCQPTCAKPDTRNIPCNKRCLASGCVCNPGYILNKTGGKCIKAEECPGGCNGDPNAVYNECPSSCPPTCDEPTRRGKACIQLCDPKKCSCKIGYILSDKGCVLPSDCPKTGQCNGDRNATITECPSACQASCAAPDTDRPCLAICLPIDCVCNQGYLLKGPNGPCVQPEDCPGGVPTCGANKTYVPCKYGCPTNYCPSSDSRGIVACSPPFVCNMGCMCNTGYLMLSYEDQRCVLASECPPVKCTRKNEVWDPTPTSCFSEKCGDRNKPCEGPSVPIGTPRCVCKPGYCRNNKDVCVREPKYGY